MADEFGNTGASMATPRQTGASSAIDSLFKTGTPFASSALDTQSTPPAPAQNRGNGIGTPSTFGGNPLGSLAPRMPKISTPSFGGVLAEQYRSILGTAYETARKMMRLGPEGERKQNPFADAGSVFGRLMGGVGNGTQPQPAQPAATPPQPAQTMQNLGAETPNGQSPALPATQNAPQPRPQIVETRGLFGGRTRSYERNGATVEIPKSVGADEASVNAYMDQTNEMIDMMDSAYADED